jgi:hypothetical protein
VFLCRPVDKGPSTGMADMLAEEFLPRDGENDAWTISTSQLRNFGADLNLRLHGLLG